MDEYTACEIAYKNGYKDGFEDGKKSVCVSAKKMNSAISDTSMMCTACYSNADRDAVYCKYCGAKFETVSCVGE